MGSAIIEVRSLCRTYGTTAAVQDLDLSVEPGEVLGLVGPNGAGKTTTLRVLAGILRPSSGRISICGHDLVGEPVAAKRRLGWVPDSASVYELLTVREHLDFAALVHGCRDRSNLDELLARFELESARDVLAASLSRGQRQKLAVARALVHGPAALLLDEPMTGLDPRGIMTVRERYLL